MRVHIRWMIKRDLTRVIDIEDNCFEFGWDDRDFRNWMKTPGCMSAVAEYDHQIVGFILYATKRHKFDIVSIAISPTVKRQGVGAQIINWLKEKLNPDKRNIITTSVRESNLDGQLFFRALGFSAVQIINSAYEEVDESAYVMSYGGIDTTNNATSGSKAVVR